MNISFLQNKFEICVLNLQICSEWYQSGESVDIDLVRCFMRAIWMVRTNTKRDLAFLPLIKWFQPTMN